MKKRKIPQIQPELHPSLPSPREEADYCGDEGASAAKTSEYAFFKKLKQNAKLGQSQRLVVGSSSTSTSQPLLQHQDRPPVHGFRSHHRCSTGSMRAAGRTSDAEKTSCKEIRSCPLVVQTDDLVSPFPSPLHYASSNSGTGVDMKKSGVNFEDLNSRQENMEGWDNSFIAKGAQERHEDIFSRKREKLRQWVTNTSFPEIGGICSHGYDPVSVLLSRLFPESREEKGFKVPNKRLEETEIEVNPLAYSQPASKFHQISTRNMMAVDDEPSSDVGWLGMPREIEISNLNSVTCHSRIPYHDNRVKELDHGLGERTMPILGTDDDSIFGFHIGEYGPPAVNHLKELDDFHCWNKSSGGRQPHALLLDWDSDNGTEESNKSTTCQNKELSLCPISPGSWNVDQQQNLVGSYTGNELCRKSLLPWHHQIPFSVHCSSSVRYGDNNFGKHSLTDFSLPLLHAKNELSLDEYIVGDNKREGGSIALSPKNQIWFMSKLVNEAHHPAGAVLLSSDSDFGSEDKCLPGNGSSAYDYMSTYHAPEFLRNEAISSHFLTEDKCSTRLDSNHSWEDGGNIHQWPRVYVEISIEKKKGYPSLLEKSNWDGSEEINSEDGEAMHF